MSKLCRRTDGGVNSGSTADGLRLIDIGSAYGGHLYSRGSMRISFLESSERVIVANIGTLKSGGGSVI